VALNVPIINMIQQGYTVVYQQTYGTAFTANDLTQIQSKCLTSNFILCVGEAEVGASNLILVSCGNCYSILQTTITNQPVLINNAYWYNTPGKSFGFAPTSIITQNSCDTTGPNDPQRLCWHMDGSSGGYRIGAIYPSGSYLKLVYVSSGLITTTTSTSMIRIYFLIFNYCYSISF